MNKSWKSNKSARKPLESSGPRSLCIVATGLRLKRQRPFWLTGAMFPLIAVILFSGCKRNADLARFEPWSVACSDDGRFVTTDEDGKINQAAMFNDHISAAFFAIHEKRRYQWQKANPGKPVPGTYGEIISEVQSRHWTTCPNPKQ